MLVFAHRLLVGNMRVVEDTVPYGAGHGTVMPAY